MKLTTCTKCENVFEDPNPGEDSKDYPDDFGSYELLPTIEHRPDEDGIAYVGYGCPYCETDGYLMDNLLQTSK